MSISFDKAENLFEKGCFEEAFTAFMNIAVNSEYDLTLRSEAYNMMGVTISGPAPYLSDSDDESGLLYFKIALQINPENLSAALNILETYNSGYTGHQDREIVVIICKSLKKNSWEKLSEDEKKSVNKAYQKLGITEKSK